MEISPQNNIPYFPDTARPLKRSELRSVTDAINYHGRITPDGAAGLLNTDLEIDSQHSANMKSLAVLGLVGSSTVARSTQSMMGDKFPDIAQVPSVADTELHSLYNLLPFTGYDVPGHSLGDHTPMLLLTAGTLYIGGIAAQGLSNMLHNGSLRQRARRAKDELKANLDGGTAQWQMETGSTVAFVSGGDPLAHDIARRRPRDIVQIASKPVSGAWVRMPEKPSREQIMQSLDSAHFAKAGELLLMPIKPSQEFLPGPDDYDMTIGQIVNTIHIAAQFCKQRGLPLKPVVIIGNRLQGETYSSVIRPDDIEGEEEKSLEQKVKTLVDKYGYNIKIIDPTEIIIERISKMAGDKPVTLYNTKRSTSEYSDRFFTAFREHHLKPNYVPPDHFRQNSHIRVVYGHWDYTTVNETRSNDIAVVLDQSQKQSLLERGIPERRILVVADEILKIAAPDLGIPAIDP